jgi:RNA polymerase sigma-70 factor (ECF subfamily)
MILAFLDLIDSYEDKIRFEELYNKYLGLMYSVARSKLKNQEDVEDVIQDALFYIAKNFNKVDDVNSNSTKNFVAVITEGFAINKFKSEVRHQNYKYDVSMPENLSDSNDFDEFDVTELKLVIDTLSDESRNILYLTYVFGYKSKEIAQMYDMTDSNVRKKIQFAKEEIRRQLSIKK